jgi:hypothetical protein
MDMEMNMDMDMDSDMNADIIIDVRNTKICKLSHWYVHYKRYF